MQIVAMMIIIYHNINIYQVFYNKNNLYKTLLLFKNLIKLIKILKLIKFFLYFKNTYCKIYTSLHPRQSCSFFKNYMIPFGPPDPIDPDAVRAAQAVARAFSCRQIAPSAPPPHPRPPPPLSPKTPPDSVGELVTVPRSVPPSAVGLPHSPKIPRS